MKKVISLIIIIFWTNYIHAQQEIGLREELIDKVLKLYENLLYDHMTSQDNYIRIIAIFYSDTVLVFNDIPNSHMKQKKRELKDYLEEIKEVKNTKNLNDSLISVVLDYDHLFMCATNDTSIFIKKKMQIGNDSNTHWLKINISYFPHTIPSNQWKITKIEESVSPQDKDSDFVPDDCDAEPDKKGNINNMGRPIIIGQDQDKDGIIDKNDKCPTEYGGKETEGCPDKDGDGVPDYRDKCPEEKGGKETDGCPDTDNDGIPDHKDKCPEQKGVYWREGCPEPPTREADTDNDGIPDKYDLCPDEYGKKELLGCPDKDGDGIPDKDDDCLNEYGPLRTKGCPDRDNDGIPDKKDKCPDIVGINANDGCPPIVQPIEQKMISRVKDYSLRIGVAISSGAVLSTLKNADSDINPSIGIGYSPIFFSSIRLNEKTKFQVDFTYSKHQFIFSNRGNDSEYGGSNIYFYNTQNAKINFQDLKLYAKINVSSLYFGGYYGKIFKADRKGNIEYESSTGFFSSPDYRYDFFNKTQYPVIEGQRPINQNNYGFTVGYERITGGGMLLGLGLDYNLSNYFNKRYESGWTESGDNIDLYPSREIGLNLHYIYVKTGIRF